MDGYGMQVVLVLALVALNAAFAGTEMALPDIGVDLDDRGDQHHRGFVTLAGLILAGLGHIPTRPGERVGSAC